MVERVKQRIVAAGRWLGDRVPLLRTAWLVHRRFSELHGGYLASAITFASFLSLFPLLLVGIAVLGFFSSGDPELPSNALRFLGIDHSDDAAAVVLDAIETAEDSRRTASIVGIVGLLWAGLGLVAALQYAFNTVWQVEGRGMRGKLFALLWLIGGGALFVTSFAVTSVIRTLPGWMAPANIVVGLALSFALFVWTAKVLPNRDVGWRPLVPGAIVGAIGLEVLKVVGSIYVPRAVATSSATYGSIGVVFAILAWLFVFSRLIIYAATVDVVRWEQQNGTAVIDIRVPNLPGPDDAAANRSGEQAPGDVQRESAATA